MVLLWSISVCAVVVAGPAEDEAERWLRNWGESATPPSIEADFVSRVKRHNLPQPVILWGRWKARFEPFYAFNLEFEASSGDSLLEPATHNLTKKQDTVSWDSSLGEGRMLKRARETLVPSGVVSNVPPNDSARVELPPSHSFYVIDDRPLKSYLKLTRVSVRLLDAAGSRFAAFLSMPASQVLHVYIFDRAKEQPIEEVQIYVPPQPFLAPKKNELLGFALQLPEMFAGKEPFVMRRVLESVKVGGYSIPTKWAIMHCSVRPTDETVISLSPASIRIEVPKEGESLLVRWPPGTQVYDPAKGVDQWIGQNQEQLSGDVISEASLDVILQGADVAPPSTPLSEKPLHLETNCAANASYLALALAGKPESLRGIVRSLGINSSSPETSLQSIRKLLDEHGVASTPVRGQAEVLAMVRTGFALLHAIRERASPAGGVTAVGHYILVDSYDPINETVRVLDPPVVPYRSALKDVLKPWSGHALLLGDSIESLASRDRGLTAAGVGLLVCSLLCFIGFAVRFKRKRMVSGLAGLLVLCVVGAGGCTSAGPAPAPAGVSVIGPAHHDFGEVRMPSKSVKHTFTLRNFTDREIRIASVKKSCTCLSAAVKPDSIPSKGQAEVTVAIDGLIMAGTKTTLTILEFDDPATKPISLTTKVYLVADYQIALAPSTWAVPPDAARDGLLRRTFQVTEFLAKEPAADETTRVLSETPEATIERVGTWKSQGWRPMGFTRETEITVAVRVPTSEASDRRIVLKFDRVHETAGTIASGQASAMVTLLLRLL